MNKPVAYVNNMCNDSIDWKIDPMDLEEGTPLYAKPPEFVQAYVNKEDGLVCAKCFNPFDDATKPVAWIDEETGCFVYSQYDYEDLDEHGKDGLIPLYTHPVKELKNIVVASATCSCGKVMEVTNLQPVKELTDEEIWDWFKENTALTKESALMIAKAILRKAQEK